MLKFFKRLHTIINSYAYMIINPYIKNKGLLIYKSILLEIFKLKKIKILNFQLKSFNSDTLKFLFFEIFIRQEYFFKSDKKSPVIIDLWSNTWMSIFYFKYLYKDSIIYWFEPDINAFEILKNNIESNKLKNVNIYNKAISDKNWILKFYSNANSSSWSFTMSSNKNREIWWYETKVETVSMLDFINSYNIKYIDLIKIDIEWWEDIIFNSAGIDNILWITDKLIMEYHHNINNTVSNLENILTVLKRNKFQYQIDSQCFPLQSENKFQDIYIYAYKRKN